MCGIVAATDCWLVCVANAAARGPGGALAHWHGVCGSGRACVHTTEALGLFPHLPLFFLCKAATYCRWRCGAAGTCLFNAKDLQADFATAMGTHTWSCARILTPSTFDMCNLEECTIMLS